jgi:hypothetical protein
MGKKMPKTRSTRHCGMALAQLALAVYLLGGTACAPDVGSERWCEKMKQTPKVDWSTREASAYGKHCLFKK